MRQLLDLPTRARSAFVFIQLLKLCFARDPSFQIDPISIVSCSRSPLTKEHSALRHHDRSFFACLIDGKQLALSHAVHIVFDSFHNSSDGSLKFTSSLSALFERSFQNHDDDFQQRVTLGHFVAIVLVQHFPCLRD